MVDFPSVSFFRFFSSASVWGEDSDEEVGRGGRQCALDDIAGDAPHITKPPKFIYMVVITAINSTFSDLV